MFDVYVARDQIICRRSEKQINRMKFADCKLDFTASDRGGETIAVNAALVRERVAPLAASGDLSRFIL